MQTAKWPALLLALLSAACAKRVEQWVASVGPGQIKSIGVLRGKVREILSAELSEIDSIVKPGLQGKVAGGHRGCVFGGGVQRQVVSVAQM
jgi:hypothetical protein